MTERNTPRYSFGVHADQKGGEDWVDHKQNGGEWLRMKGEQLGGR